MFLFNTDSFFFVAFVTVGSGGFCKEHSALLLGSGGLLHGHLSVLGGVDSLPPGTTGDSSLSDSFLLVTA